MTIPQRGVSEFEIRAPLRRQDLPGLYARVCRLLTIEDPVVAFVDVGSFACADAVTVDALARLQLAARRHDCEIRLRSVTPELHQLLVLTGLVDVLPEAQPEAG